MVQRRLPIWINMRANNSIGQAVPNCEGVRTHEEQMIPQERILSPVDSIFLTASQVMKESLGTPCGNHTTLLQPTTSFLMRL